MVGGTAGRSANRSPTVKAFSEVTSPMASIGRVPGYSTSFYWFLILILASTVGCGGRPARVSGVVSVDGKPLDRGKVSFSPTSSGQMAVSIIQDDGSYELMTNRERGLEIGDYRVSIVSREMDQTDDGGPPMQGKYLAPKRYSTPSTSGLQFSVEAGSNTIDIDLTSEGDEPEKKPRRRRRR